MLLDLAILLILCLFAVNGFRRGFLVLVGRLLILILSIVASLLMMGPAAHVLYYLPFLESLAQTLNDRVIKPLLPVAGTLTEAVAKLDLPQPVRDLLIAKFPDPNSAIIEAWPDLSTVLARFAINAITFILLLLIISLTVRTLVSLMTNLLDHVPIVGFLNRLTGFVLGALHGCLVIAVCILMAGFLSPYIPKLGSILRDSEIIAAFYRMDLIAVWITRFLSTL
jgi:uncharacterized membrane protein required for colicin V production